MNVNENLFLQLRRLRNENLFLQLMSHDVFEKVVENLQAERKIVATVIKMLPTDVSNWFKEVICDILHNEVEELYLEYNKISDEGAKALAEALKVNTALQELYLGGNNVSDEGAKALAEALKVNTALQKLWLGGNNISDAVKQQIRTDKRETLTLSF